MVGRLLASILLLLGITAGNGRTTAALTVASYDFTPKSGGPGTIVHLSGRELYYDDPLTVWLVISLGTNGPDGMITKFQPITKLGVTRPDPIGGHPEATIVIPGQMPDGSPIREHKLGIMLMDKYNKQLPEIEIKSFEFVPAPLPGTGGRTGTVWLLVLCACASLVFGLLARTLKTGLR